MRIALLGYGKMGKTIEEILIKRGHQIVFKADSSRQAKSENLINVDLAFEFSRPEAAFHNISICFDQRIPVVSGTTGWQDRMLDIKTRCTDEGQAFFYASNFSIGVNVFFAINKKLAEMLNNYCKFDVKIAEIHHANKLDEPSGTAISIANDIISVHRHYTSWTLNGEGEKTIPVTSTRKGTITGIHTVNYESKNDIIEIKHESKNREGFALGAVLASEFLLGKTGYFGMNDLLKIN